MRWTLGVILAVLVLVGAYTAWPFYGLYRLAGAVEARNAAALQELVDFPMLRRSLTSQVIAAYLKLTGKEAALGQTGTRMAVGLGASIADPIVARLLNPESLLDLLHKGSAGEGSTLPAEIAPLRSSSLSNAWRTWLNSEYSGRNFYVSLPPDKPPVQRFRIRLRLSQWKWQLASIDLPESLRVQLAREAIKDKP